MNYLSPRLALCSFLFPAAALFAELPSSKAITSVPPPKVKIVDPILDEWRTLSSVPTSVGGAMQGLDTPDKQLRQQTDRLLSVAKKARIFREKHPDSPEAGEAKCLESKNLLSVAIMTNSDPDSQDLAAALAVRADLRLPARSRFKVASLLEMLRLNRTDSDRTAFLAASEASVRKLIGEFPLEPGGYEALFHLAESQPDDWKGSALASDLMEMPAPASVKAMAQEFLDRQKLIGISLPKIAEAALGSGNLISAFRGKPMIVYSWASWNPGSVAYAKTLKSIAPSGAVLIGVNLDKDPVAAKLIAQAEALPGDQIYDARGIESPLAKALKLTTSSHVFIANLRGEIREVSAQRGNLAIKFDVATR